MDTVYKHECVKWGEAIRQKADAFYDHQIQATKDLIQDAVNKGLNPKAVDLQGGIATIDYEELLQRTIAAKNLAYNEADDRVRVCDSTAVPDWLSDVQKTSDYAMTIALMPFIIMTQQYAAAHIDLGEVYKGRTFGGDNALIPKAREDALNALGIGGDVANFLRDPGNVVQNAVVDVVKVLIPPIPIPVIPFPPIKIELPTFPPPPIPGVRLW